MKKKDDGTTMSVSELLDFVVTERKKKSKLVYFFENKLFNKYWYSHMWYAVRDFFFPRQKWLYKKLPNHWMDKDSIIERVTYACLIHFWEKDGEDGESQLRYQYEAEYQDFGSEEALQERRNTYKKAYGELLEAYNWALVREDEYKAIWENDCSTPDDIRSIIEQETAFIEYDSKMLLSIVANRSYLWT